MELDQLDHVGLAVANVNGSIRWYEEVLGLKRVFEDAWHDYPAVLAAGQSGVALFPARGASIPAGNSFDDLVHVGFRTSRRGYEAAKKQLTEQGVEFKEQDHKVAWSLYLLDPDGYLVEVTCYEPGGAARSLSDETEEPTLSNQLAWEVEGIEVVLDLTV